MDRHPALHVDLMRPTYIEPAIGFPLSERKPVWMSAARQVTSPLIDVRIGAGSDRIGKVGL
jgi:hypothetical protein